VKLVKAVTSDKPDGTRVAMSPYHHRISYFEITITYQALKAQKPPSACLFILRYQIGTSGMQPLNHNKMNEII
jgi:hypothetical protein